MTLPSATPDWVRWVSLTSHPLRHLDAHDNPDGFGSSTLIDHSGKRFALTAHHVVPLHAQGWFLEVRFSPANGTEIYAPKQWLTLIEYRRTTNDLVHVDFSYAEIAAELNTKYQEERTPWVPGEEQDRYVFESSAIADPTSAETYAFAGETRPELHAPGSIAMQMNVFPGLKYVKTADEVHIFKLPVPHPGHAEFRGCSGAPIVDMHLRVMALLINGNEEQWKRRDQYRAWRLDVEATPRTRLVLFCQTRCLTFRLEPLFSRLAIGVASCNTIVQYPS